MGRRRDNILSLSDFNRLYEDAKAIGKSNKDAFNDIETRSGHEVTLFNEYSLHCKLPAATAQAPNDNSIGDSLWSRSFTKKTRLVSDLIQGWSYNVDQLEEQIVVGPDKDYLDLSLNKYDDLARVNDGLILLIEHYYKTLKNRPEAEDALQNVLSNIRKVGDIIDEIQKLSLDFTDTYGGDDILKDGMEDIIRGFRKVSLVMPRATLTLGTAQGEGLPVAEQAVEIDFPEEDEDEDEDDESPIPNFRHSFKDPSALTSVSIIVDASPLALTNFTQEGRQYVASSGDENVINLWDVDSKCVSGTLTGHTDTVQVLTVYEMDDVNYIASGSSDNTIKLWNLSYSSLVSTLTAHCGTVAALTSYKHGVDTILVSGSRDTTVKLWDLKTHTLIKSLRGHTHAVRVVNVFEQNNQTFLVSGSYDSNLKIWNLDNQRLAATLAGHSKQILSLAILEHNDRTILASGSYDSTILLWDVVTNACIGSLVGHSDGVSALSAIKCRGRSCLASASWDGAVKIWDLDGKNEIKSISYSKAIWSMTAFHTVKKSYLVAAGSNNKIHMWTETK